MAPRSWVAGSADRRAKHHLDLGPVSLGRRHERCDHIAVACSHEAPGIDRCWSGADGGQREAEPEPEPEKPSEPERDRYCYDPPAWMYWLVLHSLALPAGSLLHCTAFPSGVVMRALISLPPSVLCSSYSCAPHTSHTDVVRYTGPLCSALGWMVHRCVVSVMP